MPAAPGQGLLVGQPGGAPGAGTAGQLGVPDVEGLVGGLVGGALAIVMFTVEPSATSVSDCGVWLVTLPGAT